MKASLLFTFLVVLLAGILAWLQHDRITVLEEEHRTLVQRATALGLSVEGLPPTKSAGSGSAAGGSAVATASRSKATAKEFGAELIALMKEMEEWEEKGEQPPPEMMREAMAFFQRFLELDSEVIAHLIDELRSSTEIDEDKKGEIIMVSFMAMAQSSPEAALNLFVRSRDMLGDLQRSKHMIQMALGSLATEDPEGALAWLDLNAGALPEEAARDARKTAVAAAFVKDPELAVRLTLDLDREVVGQIGGAIAHYARSPEGEDMVLRALKGELGDLPTTGAELDDESASKGELLRGGIVSGLASTLGSRPFDEAAEFLEEAELSDGEMSQLAESIGMQGPVIKNPGEWLPWIDAHSDPAAREENVTRLVSHWTNTDFRSTADWITAQPEGPLRQEATHAFADTVAPHEPASAADWAVTLPVSEERTTLLNKIHQHWKKRDETAAAEFAAKNGLLDR